MEGSSTARALRVLIATECFLPAVNGVTTSVIRSAAHLEGVGHTVRILAPRPTKRGGATATLQGGGPSPIGGRGPAGRVIAVRSVALPGYPSLRVGVPSAAHIEAVLRSFRPDVVHLAAPTLFGGRVVAACRRLDIPTVAIFQTDLAGFATNYRGLAPAAGPIWRWLRRVHERADLTLAPTPTVARELTARRFGPVEVWGRGVDRHQFDPRRRSPRLRQSWDLDGRAAVGFVGRLAAEKRVDRLAVLNDRTDIRLVVVGDGPERDRLQDRLPGAHFTGMLVGDELGQAMASLDVFVHTGEHETFCQTIQEAMASGVPVVAPAAGGPIDLVADGSSGRLFRPGDDADMAAAVGQLVADPGARARLVQGGYEAIGDRTWESIGNQLVVHYRRAIASHARPAWPTGTGSVRSVTRPLERWAA